MGSKGLDFKQCQIKDEDTKLVNWILYKALKWLTTQTIEIIKEDVTISYNLCPEIHKYLVPSNGLILFPKEYLDFTIMCHFSEM